MASAESPPHPLIRVGCLLLAAVAGEVGVWAAFFPRNFYLHFPGAKHAWVSADGPYNQHLVRDVGQLNLTVAILLVVAAFAASRQLRQAVLGAYLVQAVLHLTYHATHLSRYVKSSDKVGTMASLGLGVVLAVVLLVAEPVLSGPATRGSAGERATRDTEASVSG
jgi:heme/copper-type cytochrome/quinol oxidase subunit 4